MNALVSVVMLPHSKEGEIRRTVGSLINQECRDFKSIELNGGSTNSVPRTVNGYRDSRMQIALKANASVSAARNRGSEWAVNIAWSCR
jgi:glycosyltransferase involved in cell wall biosynthesis